MSRYIDADAIKYFVSVTNDGCFYRVAFKDEIDKIPTADVVKVVRCKDCTRQMICFHSDDYFCADGERREDELCYGRMQTR